MNCPNCGKLIPEEAQTCPFCLFAIKDWKKGKIMTNDRGQILPKYVPENEKQEIIDDKESLTVAEQKSTHSFRHRSLRAKNDHGRIPYSAHHSHAQEPNSLITSFEQKKSESNRSQPEGKSLSEKKRLDSKEGALLNDPTSKTSHSSSQTYTFSYSKRADQIEAEAIKNKYNSSNSPVSSTIENNDLIGNVHQPDCFNGNLQQPNNSFNQEQFDNTPVDDITNVNFEEPETGSTKRKKTAKVIVLIFFALIVVLGIILAFSFLMRSTIGGKSIDAKAFSNFKTTIISKEGKQKSRTSPKKIAIRISGFNRGSIPLKNITILANEKPVKFQADEKIANFNDDQAEITGELSDLKLFSNKLSLKVTSDQNKKLYQSKESQVIFPFDLAGTCWETQIKSDVNSPETTVKINFISDHSYEETVDVAKVAYEDTKNIKRWTTTSLTGSIVSGKANDGSIRYLTNPQQFVETEYISNFHHGKEPITRIKYKGGQEPADLSDYRHELRLRNNKLYYFMTTGNQQVKTQIFLLDEIEPHNFTAFSKTDVLPEVKQKGLTVDSRVRKEIRQRILQNFTDQLTYQMPDRNLAHLNTIFYDAANGQQATGLITYFSGGKVNNLMKFIIYRNGRLNVYPLNSDFEVPKSYTINIYKDLKNNNFESFPDFKK